MMCDVLTYIHTILQTNQYSSLSWQTFFGLYFQSNRLAAQAKNIHDLEIPFEDSSKDTAVNFSRNLPVTLSSLVTSVLIQPTLDLNFKPEFSSSEGKIFSFVVLSSSGILFWLACIFCLRASEESGCSVYKLGRSSLK